VFGAMRALVGNFVRHDEGHYTLDYDFVLEPGTPSFPTPPIP
jgi:catechol 1,2-dioxygenase